MTDPTLTEITAAGLTPERFVQALRLRMAGWPLEHVARDLGLTDVARAYVDVHDPVEIFDPAYELPIISDGFIDALYGGS